MPTLNEKAKFLLEVIDNPRYDGYIRRTAREALNSMGISDPQIDEYIERKLFVNQLHEDDDQTKNLHEYSERKPIFKSASFLAALLVTLLIGVAIMFGFAMVVTDKDKKTDRVIESVETEKEENVL